MTPMNDGQDNGHRALWDLIPWVAAGSASAADRQRLQHHLRGCDSCRQEMAFHQDLVLGMHSQRSEPDANTNADAALQRLWARLDSDTTAAAPPPAAPTRGPRATNPLLRGLMAAVLLQSVGLAALAGLLLTSGRDAPYQTLSTPAPATAGVQLRLVPAPSLPMSGLSALLSAHGLQIVESNADGTVLGLALVAGAGSPATVQALAHALRRQPGVLLAEPAPTAPGH
jgi:Putative zinc-finger